MKITNKLFVYGTLGPGRPNQHILSSIHGSWEEASVIGYLHKEGWGAELGYPGLTLNNDGAKVEGFLFSSDELAEHWTMLDEFEGDGYERAITSVKLKNNTSVDAYIYTLKLIV